MRTALLVLLLLFNAACIPLTDYENTQEDSRDALIYLDENHRAQQTLILRRVPVESIILWIVHPAEGAPPATSLTLTLEGRSGRGPQRVGRTYGLPSLAASTPSPFPLPPTDFLPNRPVTLTLEVHGGGLWLYGRAEEAYPPGALTLDGTPQEGDLAFRLTYDYGPAALLSDARALLPRLWLLLPLAALLLLPGLALSGQASAVGGQQSAVRRQASGVSGQASAVSRQASAVSTSHPAHRTPHIAPRTSHPAPRTSHPAHRTSVASRTPPIPFRPHHSSLRRLLARPPHLDNSPPPPLDSPAPAPARPLAPPVHHLPRPICCTWQSGVGG